MGKTTLPALIGGATKTTAVGQDNNGSFFALHGLVDILGNLLGTESNPLVVKIAGASSDAPHIVSGAYDSSGNLVFTLSDGSTLPPIAPPAGGPTTAPVSISGFYLNGASSPKLKAAVSRIKAGTGRGRMVMKGDSTTVGQGAGSTADGYGLTGARPNRIAKVLAGLLTSAGTPTLDGSLVSDNGMWVANNFSLLDYDSCAVLPITGPYTTTRILRVVGSFLAEAVKY